MYLSFIRLCHASILRSTIMLVVLLSLPWSGPVLRANNAQGPKNADQAKFKPYRLGIITGNGGKAIGETWILEPGSMQFDSSGQNVVGMTGKQEWKATAPEGLSLWVTLQFRKQNTVGRLNISDIIFGGSAKGLAIESITFAKNEFSVGQPSVMTGEPEAKATVVRYSLVSGQLYLQLLSLEGYPQRSWFVLDLVRPGPLQGTLQQSKEPATSIELAN